MIDAGVPVAISTDCNPGSSPTTSMPLVMNLACISMRLTPAEALTAATYNAACAIQMEDKTGSLEPGKQGDVVLVEYFKLPRTPISFRSEPREVRLEKRRESRRIIGMDFRIKDGCDD